MGFCTFKSVSHVIRTDIAFVNELAEMLLTRCVDVHAIIWSHGIEPLSC